VSSEEHLFQPGDKGIRSLFRELLSDSLLEFRLGHCTRITIAVDDELNASIVDNGRPFLFSVGEQGNQATWVEHAWGTQFGTLHSRQQTPLPASAAVFASAFHWEHTLLQAQHVCEYLMITSGVDGKRKELSLRPNATADHETFETRDSDSCNKVQFRPELSFFGKPENGNRFWRTLAPMLQGLAVCSPGLHLSLVHQPGGRRLDFHYPDGAVNLLAEMPHEAFYTTRIGFQHVAQGMSVDVALEWSCHHPRFDGFVAGIHCNEGVFKDAIRSALQEICKSPLRDELWQRLIYIDTKCKAVVVMAKEQVGIIEWPQDVPKDDAFYDLIYKGIKLHVPERLRALL
jgi:hypothetical protein